MNISQLLSSSTASLASSSQSTTQASSALSPVLAGITKSSTALQAKLDAATTSLSTLGQFKSAVSLVQTAAQGLSGFQTSSTSDDVKAGITSFITKFNAMVASAQTAAAQTSGTDKISSTMSRALSADLSKISDLRNMGFTKASDGTLKLDATKFAAAYKASPSTVQTALSKLGKLVDKAAGKELASDGRIASSVSALTSKSTLLQTQRTALLKAVQQFSASQSSTTSNALSAYTSNA
ncbi:flagellar filament capping protein FliD [Rhodoferax sp. GW822-FHT02A01]|uniref:flagellar filament capping protein FliD n=1 Tax=Rhodoferax sp. GW822-FHT02A01 TaxID=3141537 RepID=UPI00315DC128